MFKDMLGIAQSVLTPLIKEWVHKHQHVPPNVLVVYLTTEVMNFGTNFLNKQLLIPNWDAIKNKGGKSVDWLAFLEIPENLFN